MPAIGYLRKKSIAGMGWAPPAKRPRLGAPVGPTSGEACA